MADYWMAGRVPIEVRPLEVSGELALGVQLVADAEWLDAEVTRHAVVPDGRRSGWRSPSGASCSGTTAATCSTPSRPISAAPRARGAPATT